MGVSNRLGKLHDDIYSAVVFQSPLKGKIIPVLHHSGDQFQFLTIVVRTLVPYEDCLKVCG